MMPSSSDGSPTNRPRSRSRQQQYYDDRFAPPPSFPYRCHQCRSNVLLHSPIPPLVCPRCNGEFLEELIRNPIPPLVTARLRPPPYGDDDANDQEGDEEDRRFLDIPGEFSPNFMRNHNFIDHRGHNYHHVFERLMQHIDTADVDIGNICGPCPASKASINAIPTIQITESFLAADPNSSCAVCKEDFVLGTEAKKLPCNHIYHGDCIIPWLTRHNSCPVCRFQLPTSGSGSSRGGGGGGGRDGQQQHEGPSLHTVSSSRSRRRMRMMRNSSDAEIVEALNMGGGVLAHIARRSRVPIPVRSGSGGGVSPTQMAEAHAGGSVGPTNSLETVSSVWHDGSGVAATSAMERADEETDVVMSTDRRGFIDS